MDRTWARITCCISEIAFLETYWRSTFCGVSIWRIPSARKRLRPSRRNDRNHNPCPIYSLGYIFHYIPSVSKSGAAKKRSSESQLAKSGVPITSFGDILIMSPVQRQYCHQKTAQTSHCTVFLMELCPQRRQANSPAELHICEPPFCTCCTVGTGEVRKGMEVDVIDNVDEAIEQQAKGCRQNPQLKGWQ